MKVLVTNIRISNIVHALDAQIYNKQFTDFRGRKYPAKGKMVTKVQMLLPYGASINSAAKTSGLGLRRTRVLAREWGITQRGYNTNHCLTHLGA
jgi:hypothetical protein